MLRPILLLTLFSTPAFAEGPAWPEEFVSIIGEAKSYCQGDFSVAPEAISQHDLNGDGTQDWLLDAAGFACSDSYGLYCGTGGCGLETLIDGTLSSLLLLSWDIVTDSGVTYLTAPNNQGQTVRLRWTGTEWQLQ